MSKVGGAIQRIDAPQDLCTWVPTIIQSPFFTQDGMVWTLVLQHSQNCSLRLSIRFGHQIRRAFELYVPWSVQCVSYHLCTCLSRFQCHDLQGGWILRRLYRRCTPPRRLPAFHTCPRRAWHLLDADAARRHGRTTSCSDVVKWGPGHPGRSPHACSEGCGWPTGKTLQTRIKELNGARHPCHLLQSNAMHVEMKDKRVEEIVQGLGYAKEIQWEFMFAWLQTFHPLARRCS
mmetsp:Transcript_4872/g.31163  ORF Transcript_4872/g.31163 Transcript_4872/m.31163 type:complete len:232 (-) Transcript_4872:2423-3118(-)